MVLLASSDAFLAALAQLYAAHQAAGSVFVNAKRCEWELENTEADGRRVWELDLSMRRQWAQRQRAVAEAARVQLSGVGQWCVHRRQAECVGGCEALLPASHLIACATALRHVFYLRMHVRS